MYKLVVVLPSNMSYPPLRDSSFNRIIEIHTQWFLNNLRHQKDEAELEKFKQWTTKRLTEYADWFLEHGKIGSNSPQ